MRSLAATPARANAYPNPHPNPNPNSPGNPPGSTLRGDLLRANEPAAHSVFVVAERGDPEVARMELEPWLFFFSLIFLIGSFFPFFF